METERTPECSLGQRAPSQPISIRLAFSVFNSKMRQFKCIKLRPERAGSAKHKMRCHSERREKLRHDLMATPSKYFAETIRLLFYTVHTMKRVTRNGHSNFQTRDRWSDGLRRCELYRSKCFPSTVFFFLFDGDESASMRSDRISLSLLWNWTTFVNQLFYLIKLDSIYRNAHSLVRSQHGSFIREFISAPHSLSNLNYLIQSCPSTKWISRKRKKKKKFEQEIGWVECIPLLSADWMPKCVGIVSSKRSVIQYAWRNMKGKRPKGAARRLLHLNLERRGAFASIGAAIAFHCRANAAQAANGK